MWGTNALADRHSAAPLALVGWSVRIQRVGGGRARGRGAGAELGRAERGTAYEDGFLGFL